MFASTTTKDITVNGDDGASVVVTIQKLSWKKLRKAAEASTAAAIASAATVGADRMKAMREIAPKPEDGKVEDPAAKYRQYDREKVLIYGVLKWTSSVQVQDGLEDLDEAVADQLHRAILDLSIPSDEKAVQGEGSARSTVS